MIRILKTMVIEFAAMIQLIITRTKLTTTKIQRSNWQ